MTTTTAPDHRTFVRSDYVILAAGGMPCWPPP